MSSLVERAIRLVEINRAPRGAPDGNRDGKGDGGQFARAGGPASGTVHRVLRQVANGKSESMSSRRKQDLVWRGLAQWESRGVITLTAKGRETIALSEAAVVALEEINKNHAPKGAPDRNKDGKGDGGQFVASKFTGKPVRKIKPLAGGKRLVPSGTTIEADDNFDVIQDSDGPKKIAKLDLRQFADVFDAYRHDGLEVKVLSVRAQVLDRSDYGHSFDPRRKVFTVNMEVRDTKQSGSPVVSDKFIRTLIQYPKDGGVNEGKTVLKNDGLVLDKSAQRRGFASAFNKMASATFKAQGVDHMQTHAGDADGGYVWAKSRWLPDPDTYDEGDPDTAARNWSKEAFLAPSRGSFNKYKTFAKEFPEQVEVVKELQAAVNAGRVITPAELAAWGSDQPFDYDGEPAWVGKWILSLSYGPKASFRWRGVKPL